MKTKEWMCGIGVVFLTGTIAFGQGGADPRPVRFLQPKAADGPVQPEPLPQPRPVEKQDGAGKGAKPGEKAGAVPGEKQEMPGGKNGKGTKESPEILPEPIAKALPAPKLEAGEEGLVISLPAALKLANVDAWDIVIATQQMEVAVAQWEGARVLWLPTLIGGVDYVYHSGPYQNPDGTLLNASRAGMYAGGAPQAIFALTDAIFAPLAARQDVRAQTANIQTARNDTLTDLAQAYYDLLEAEADLASVVDIDRRTGELLSKVIPLAPDIVPALEVDRTRAFKYNTEQLIETARQRWRNASAEVARIARLKPTVVLQPLEPPHIRVTLVPETMTPDELVPIGLSRRPELTFYEAEAAAARERERQEKWRIFLPTLIARGGGSTPPYPMAVGGFGGGPGTDLNNFTQRSDWDFSAIWTLQNMGLGNRALIKERVKEFELARTREYKFRDIVAKEVVVGWSDVRSASRRVSQSERELREALLSARKNMIGVSEIKRPALNINIQVIRTQEVIQSLQALNAAYINYYGVVAEYNRAQFRLYRALGNPAQMLAGHDGLGGPLLPTSAPAPAPAPKK